MKINNIFIFMYICVLDSHHQRLLHDCDLTFVFAAASGLSPSRLPSLGTLSATDMSFGHFVPSDSLLVRPLFHLFILQYSSRKARKLQRVKIASFMLWNSRWTIRLLAFFACCIILSLLRAICYQQDGICAAKRV